MALLYSDKTCEQQRKPKQTQFLHQLHKLLWWVVLWWGWSAPQCSSPRCWTPAAAQPAWAATPTGEECPHLLTPLKPRGSGPAAHTQRLGISTHRENIKTWDWKYFVSLPDIKLHNLITDVFIQYLLTTHKYDTLTEKSQSSSEFSHWNKVLKLYLVN